jgi:hypothetical protein
MFFFRNRHLGTIILTDSNLIIHSMFQYYIRRATVPEPYTSTSFRTAVTSGTGRARFRIKSRGRASEKLHPSLLKIVSWKRPLEIAQMFPKKRRFQTLLQMRLPKNSLF